jgi:hypothetical protein
MLSVIMLDVVMLSVSALLNALKGIITHIK